jgi:hypothetical protein
MMTEKIHVILRRVFQITAVYSLVVFWRAFDMREYLWAAYLFWVTAC